MNKKANLSVVISAFNEEDKIADCLESVAFADEVILVDNSSTDKTVSIAKKFSPVIISRQNNPMLNVNKNVGFLKAKHEWILNLDADERVTSELQEEIVNILSSQNTAEGYLLPRKNIIFGKWIQHGLWWSDYQLRLFKAAKGKFPEEHVHEMIKVTGSVEKLQHPMLHYNYQSVTQYLYKLDKIYTENEVERFIKEGKTVTPADAIRFPVSDFLKTFFLQQGYKDGMHGLALSMLQAIYAEVMFLKIWEKQGFDQMEEDGQFLKNLIPTFKRSGSEFSYWIMTVLMQQTKNPLEKTLYRFKRKKVQQKLQ